MITINRYLSQIAPWAWTLFSLMALFYLGPAYRIVLIFERRRPSNVLTRRTKTLIYLLTPLSVGFIFIGCLSIARWFLYPMTTQARFTVPMIFQLNQLFSLLVLLAVPVSFAIIGRMELRGLQGRNGQSHE